MSEASIAPFPPPMGLPLHQQKSDLRRRVLGARDGAPEKLRALWSAAIAAAIAARPDFARSRSVLLTHSFGSEWQTGELIDAALRAGKTVALPRVDLDSRMLELCVVTDGTVDVAPGFRGIREPLPHCSRIVPSAIDWVLVPGVAFNRRGGRLGYGGGFYDRLLPLLAPQVPRVAGAFEIQILDAIPAAPHDCHVDAIVTEAGSYAA